LFEQGFLTGLLAQSACSSTGVAVPSGVMRNFSKAHLATLPGRGAGLGNGYTVSLMRRLVRFVSLAQQRIAKRPAVGVWGGLTSSPSVSSWVLPIALPMALSLALPLVFVGAAYAQQSATEEQLAEARRHYEVGKRLYDLERYEEAVPEFQAAYALSGDAVFLYNVAQSHRRAENFEAAIHYYETYLKRAPQTPRRDEVQRRLRELTRASTPPNQVDAPNDGPPVAEPAAGGSPRAVSFEVGASEIDTPEVGSPEAGPPDVGPPVSDMPPAPPKGTYTVRPLSGADAPPGAPGRIPGRAEHTGLHARAMVGLGAFQALLEDETGELSVSGGGPALTLELGYNIRPGLALLGQMFVLSSSSVTLEINGDEAEVDTSAGLVSVGFGVLGYLHSNFWFSGSLSLTTLSTADPILSVGFDAVEEPFGVGFGLLGGLGYEWLLGPEVGLGIAGQLHLGGMAASDELGTDSAWSTVALVISGTITYN